MGRRMTVDQFLEAVEGVKDDGKYAQRLKEIETREQALAEKLAIAGTVEHAQALLAEAQVKLCDAGAQFDAAVREAERTRGELTEERRRQAYELDSRASAARQREAELDKREQGIAAAQRQLLEDRKRLQQDQARHGQEDAELSKKQRALADRVHRIVTIAKEAENG